MAISQGTCSFEGCEEPRRKAGKNRKGAQRYSRYCWRHDRDIYDPNHAERKRAWHKLHPHRLTYEERKKNKLRKSACERCGWSEARCDLHRIISGGPYTEENTITLCPNCHRVETEMAKLQNGFGGRDRPAPPLP